MSAVLLAVTGLDPTSWEQRFRMLAPRRELRLWPDRRGDPADVAYACAWYAPRGALAGFPNLKAVFSLGAGVDHILNDPTLPDVPVVRIVDPDLTMRMTEYVVLHVLLHHRRQRLYDAQQRARHWYEHAQPPASAVAVGVMGLGVLGSAAVQALAGLGFRTAGWSRTAKDTKTLPGIETFHGQDGLDAFLARTEILVCLLPATPVTLGILRLKLLRKLKRDGAAGGAYLINAGRGALQVDADILTALDDGTLAGASLDVFPTEPLPVESPFWTHPKVTITPHNAAASDPDALVANILRQIERLEAGQRLEHVIDRTAGY
jgi:glyoxylate/hydroxypyruvate reductase A